MFVTLDTVVQWMTIKIIFSHCAIYSIWCCILHPHILFQESDPPRDMCHLSIFIFFPFARSLSLSFTHVHTGTRRISKPMILKFLFPVSNMFYLLTFDSESGWMSGLLRKSSKYPRLSSRSGCLRTGSVLSLYWC